MRLLLLVLALLLACNGSTSPDLSKAPEVRTAAPVASKSDESVPTGLFAAKGEKAVERAIDRATLYIQPQLPPKSVDILSKLGITIINELPEAAGITDDMIRAAADVSYERLGIADPSMRDWTLFVRLPPRGTNQTSFNEKKKFVVVEINPYLFSFAGPHELSHVLSGRVLWGNWLPGIMGEFVATAAELYQPPDAETSHFTYEVLNRPILGTGKSLSGEEDRIHAEGAPLDGVRYELLRQAGKKIGDDAYRKLAADIYKAAVTNGGPLSMDDLKPAFEKAGLGDCVLFTHTTEPGVYVDLVVAIDHSPVIFIKYIDGTGQESMPQASFSLTWKKGGETITQYRGVVVPMFVDNGSLPFAGTMDELVVTVGNLTYIYTIKDAP